MATYDVVLPGNQRPKFPAICVGCELEHPSDFARIAVTGAGGSALGWGYDAASMALGDAPSQGSNRRVKVEVPCCPKCARALERRHFWKSILLYASGFGGAAAAAGIIVKGKARGIPASIVPYVGVVACVGIVVLPVIWELRSPPAFTITPTASGVTYEFRSAKCGEAFVKMNQITELR